VRQGDCTSVICKGYWAQQSLLEVLFLISTTIPIEGSIIWRYGHPRRLNILRYFLVDYTWGNWASLALVGAFWICKGNRNVINLAESNGNDVIWKRFKFLQPQALVLISRFTLCWWSSSWRGFASRFPTSTPNREGTMWVKDKPW
jgi:hypothetical protein